MLELVVASTVIIVTAFVKHPANAVLAAILASILATIFTPVLASIHLTAIHFTAVLATKFVNCVRKSGVVVGLQMIWLGGLRADYFYSDSIRDLPLGRVLDWFSNGASLQTICAC